MRDWAEGLDLPEGGETILFVDCEAAFYRTSYARAFARLLLAACVEFGLMREQWCCGGPAAEMGYVEKARAFAEHNIWEQRLDDSNWAAWVRCKREISEVTLKYGGSITACHGATREGDAELVPTEMGSSWEVVKRVKRALDPNNVMDPGKQMVDEAYE